MLPSPKCLLRSSVLKMQPNWLNPRLVNRKSSTIIQRRWSDSSYCFYSSTSTAVSRKTYPNGFAVYWNDNEIRFFRSLINNRAPVNVLWTISIFTTTKANVLDNGFLCTLFGTSRSHWNLSTQTNKNVEMLLPKMSKKKSLDRSHRVTWVRNKLLPDRKSYQLGLKIIEMITIWRHFVRSKTAMYHVLRFSILKVAFVFYFIMLTFTKDIIIFSYFLLFSSIYQQLLNFQLVICQHFQRL